MQCARTDVSGEHKPCRLGHTSGDEVEDSGDSEHRGNERLKVTCVKEYIRVQRELNVASNRLHSYVQTCMVSICHNKRDADVLIPASRRAERGEATTQLRSYTM